MRGWGERERAEGREGRKEREREAKKTFKKQLGKFEYRLYIR